MEESQNAETIIRWIVIAIVFFLALLCFIILLIKSIFKKIVKTKMAEAKAKLEHQQDLIESSITTQARIHFY